MSGGVIIEQVRIKNFRSLKDVTVILAPNVTVLIGPNNAGKTSFLRALHLAFAGDRRQVNREDLFIGSGGTQLPEEDQFITIDIKIIPAEGEKDFEPKWLSTFARAVIDNPSSGQSYSFQTKISFGNDLKEIEISRFAFSSWDEKVINDEWEVTTEIRDIPFYFMDAQRDLVEDINLRTSNIGRMANKFQDDYLPELVAKIEKDLEKLNQEAVEGSAILSHIKTSLEELNQTVQGRGKGVEITPLPKKVRDLHKGMKIHFQDGDSDSFSLEYHGMGTRSWASLLAFKARISWETIQKNTKPFFPILGLEEPEAHLHPNAQRMIYNQLSEIEGQKIVSTHSPYLAGQCNLSEMRFFSKVLDKVSITQIEGAAEFKPHQITSMERFVMHLRGELIFSKCVILVEGETEERFLPFLFDAYFGNYNSIGINICGVGGDNLKDFIKVLTSAKIPLFVFSDYDTVENKDKVSNQLENAGYDPAKCEILIDLGEGLESYLKNSGYEAELKSACREFNTNWFSRLNIREDINKQVDLDPLPHLLKYKAKIAPFYGKIISELPQGRRYPHKILELLKKVELALNLKVDDIQS